MPSSTEAVSGLPVRRRVPWALVPFVVAGAYVAVHALVRHRPPLEQMVPDDAFVTWRWKDAATYDRTRTPPPGPEGIPAVPASEVLGAELNLPGLPGVDRSRPILETWLTPEGRVDPRFFVLPVSDRAALIAKYRDPALRERHARFVEVHGDWAACAWDRNAVRTAGWSHGLLPPSIGESWCVAADWPKLVDFALQPDQAGGEPYRSALAALGFAPHKQERTVGADGPQVAVAGGRVPFVREAWTSVTLYSFDDRIRVELHPSPAGDLDEALAAALAAAEPGPAVERVSGAEAWLFLPDAHARRTLALALWYGGLAWPGPALKDGFASLHLDHPGALAMWAEMSPGPFATWTLALAGPKGVLPDLAAFDLPDVAAGATVPLPAGASKLLTPYGGEPKATELAREPLDREGFEVVTLGSSAGAVAQRIRSASPVRTPPQTPRSSSGPHATLATFHLSQVSAQRLLSAALVPRGLLFALAEGAIDGEVWTDGKTLIVEARRVAR